MNIENSENGASVDFDHSYRTPKPGLYQSQHGEDIWLDGYFSQKIGGYFVEVGAYDGVVLSNTFFFEKGRGWTGVLVEPDPENAESCRLKRPNAKIFQCAAAAPDTEVVTFAKVKEGGVYSTSNLNQDHELRLAGYGLEYENIVVPAKPLDQILDESGAVPDKIDLMTIDVEEAEIEVLRGFCLVRWKPKIVMIESNHALRKPEIRDYFTRNGYAYMRSIAINDFYAPVAFGALLAPAVDRWRYYLANRKRRGASVLRTRIRQFLDRYLLWRFK